MKSPVKIAAFYHFAPVLNERLSALAEEIESRGIDQGLKGLIILATEGINGTISASSGDQIHGFFNFIEEKLALPQLEARWSEAEAWPFRKFKVRLRDEIVTLGKPDIHPLPGKSDRHLSAREWQRVLKEEDVLVLDTRNWYETQIGKFRGAIDPKLDEFQEFSSYLDQAELPKDKKILIYCTGGIRCEKAIVEMDKKGFENVFQLEGGILSYLAQFPHHEFTGECFVFDQRVALDQDLKPTTVYKMCPHCGQPADQVIQCVRCDNEAVLCTTCASDEKTRSCSKNCAHHQQMAPEKKGRAQRQGYRFRRHP